MVDAGHAPLGGTIDEQVVGQVGKAVAGGAVDRPVVGQTFVFSEDLFDDQIEGQRIVRRQRTAADHLLQAPEITSRIIEPVGMVDAQSIDLALGQQIEDEAVGGFEYCRLIHAQGGQVVDVEKTSVVDLVGGNAPEGEAVTLLLNQLVQQVEAGFVAGLAIEFRQNFGDVMGDVGTGRAQGCEVTFVHFLVALALGHARRVGVGTCRQVA